MERTRHAHVDHSARRAVPSSETCVSKKRLVDERGHWVDEFRFIDSAPYPPSPPPMLPGNCMHVPPFCTRVLPAESWSVAARVRLVIGSLVLIPIEPVAVTV